MKALSRAFFVALTVLAVGAAAQPSKKPGVLPSAEVKNLVPASFFFDGQVAQVQLRNALAIRTQSGKIVSAGLVDTAGYSVDVAQKYQGFLITETKLSVEKASVPPGAYGFGFSADGKFRIMDIAGNDLVTVSYRQDDSLKRPVPLKAVAEGSTYRLYAGKKYVPLELQ